MVVAEKNRGSCELPIRSPRLAPDPGIPRLLDKGSSYATSTIIKLSNIRSTVSVLSGSSSTYSNMSDLVSECDERPSVPFAAPPRTSCLRSGGLVKEKPRGEAGGGAVQLAEADETSTQTQGRLAVAVRYSGGIRGGLQPLFAEVVRGEGEILCRAIESRVRMLNPGDAASALAALLLVPPLERTILMLRALTETGRYIHVKEAARCSIMDRRSCAVWFRMLQRLQLASFNKPTQLLEAGKPADRCYWVLLGEVLVEEENGRSMIAEQWAGLGLEVLEGLACRSTVSTLHPVTLCYLTIDDWKECQAQVRAAPFETLRLEQVLVTHVKHRRTQCSCEVTASFAGLRFFYDMDNCTRLELCKQVDLVMAPAGTLLYSKGDNANFFYIVLSGEVLLVDGAVEPGTQHWLLDGSCKPGSPERFVQGDVFGSATVLDRMSPEPQKQSKSAVAVEDSRILLLSKNVYHRVVRKSTQEKVQRRIRQLTTHPMLHGLTDKQLVMMLYNNPCQEREYRTGATLLVAGSLQRHVHFVLSGEVALVAAQELPGGGTQSLEVYRIQEGRCLGLAGLLGQPEALSAVACSQTVLLSVPIDSLQSALGKEGLEQAQDLASSTLEELQARTRLVEGVRSSVRSAQRKEAIGCGPDIRDNVDVITSTPSGLRRLPRPPQRTAPLPPETASQSGQQPLRLAPTNASTTDTAKPHPGAGPSLASGAPPGNEPVSLRASTVTMPSLPLTGVVAPLPPDSPPPPSSSPRARVASRAAANALMPNRFAASKTAHQPAAEGRLSQCVNADTIADDRNLTPVDTTHAESQDDEAMEQDLLNALSPTEVRVDSELVGSPSCHAEKTRAPRAERLMSVRAMQSLMVEQPSSALVYTTTGGRSALILSCRVTDGRVELDEELEADSTMQADADDCEAVSKAKDTGMVAILSLPPIHDNKKGGEQASNPGPLTRRLSKTATADEENEPPVKLRGIALFRNAVKLVTAPQRLFGTGGPKLPLEKDLWAPRVTQGIRNPSLGDIHYLLRHWSKRWRKEHDLAKAIAGGRHTGQSLLQDLDERADDDLEQFGSPVPNTQRE